MKNLLIRLRGAGRMTKRMTQRMTQHVSQARA